MDRARSLRHLSNQELVLEVGRLAREERHATVRLIECLDEFDRRNLFLDEGFSSLFNYCTGHLGLCEYAAYARIEIARVSRRFPELLVRMKDGRLNLTNAGLLAPHLTAANHVSLLDEAANKKKDEIKAIVARLKPQPAAATTIRRAPAPPPPAAVPAEPKVVPTAAQADMAVASQPDAPPLTVVAAVPKPTVTPLAPEQYRVQLTISRETRDKLREVQDLMRHTIPNGDAAVIFERAISLLLEDLRRKKLAITNHPRAASKPASPDSRHIPAAVKRAVTERDKRQCAFVGARGRCEERGFLEFHHVVPYAAGGMATIENIQLRCRAHNAHEAELYFGVSQVRQVRGVSQ